MNTTFHHRRTARISRKFVVTAQDSPIPRYVQALHAGFAQTPHLSALLHSRRRIAVTPLIKRRLETLARLLHFPADQIFVEEPKDDTVAAR